MNLASESAIQLSYTVSLIAVTCGGTYPDERIMDVIIEGLPLDDSSGVSMFRGHKFKAHLTERAQYADTLLKQQHGGEREPQALPEEPAQTSAYAEKPSQHLSVDGQHNYRQPEQRDRKDGINYETRIRDPNQWALQAL